MNYQWIRSKWNRYYKPVYRILMFIAVSLLAVFLLPNSGKFKYEYELGRPWKYNDLIAPFDFPIFKSNAEIAAERDSVVANFVPYFVRDSIAADSVSAAIRIFVSNGRGEIARACGPETEIVTRRLNDVILSVLMGIYDKGVIQLPDNYDSQNGSEYEFMLVYGNLAEPYALSEMYTCSRAYNHLVAAVADSMAPFGEAVRQAVGRMPFYSLVAANVLPDNARTEQERMARINTLTLTSGKMVAGQKIIATGELVDSFTSQVIESLDKVYDSQLGANRTMQIVCGQLLMILCLMATLFMFLQIFRREVFDTLRCVNLILLMMVLVIVGSSMMSARHFNLSQVAPFVMLPIVLRTLLDSRIAMYVHTVTMIIVSFFAYNSFMFILLHIPAGMLAIMSLSNLSRRVQIFKAAVYVVVYYVLVYIGMRLWQMGEVSSVSITSLAMFALNGVLIALSYPLIYILERLFGFLSDVTLVELSDTNNPLLRQLAEKAPGTFHHSMQVGTLAQAVAYEIKANPMLVRTGAMYHDIGKMVAPLYFTENQTNNINPHDSMDLEESARLVIRHVANGVQIARKHNLPQQVIDFITTHQGTTVTRYFYVLWLNAHQGQTPDDATFRYPGPKPFSKETAILMMADAVEASSRSLTDFSDERIDALVEKIVDGQISEHQFDDAPITLKEISIAKKVFKQKLKNMYHARVQYPELLK